MTLRHAASLGGDPNPGNLNKEAFPAIRPLLVSGYGRSGTTAIMNLLSTDPAVSCDRAYPFETRQLSYIAKLSSIAENRFPSPVFTPDHLYDFSDSSFGPQPWPGHRTTNDVEWLPSLWRSLEAKLLNQQPTARFYAEKAPMWLPSLVRRTVPCSVIHLFRDPRDIFISSNAFMQRNHYYGFHRTEADTDLDHARRLSLEYVNYFENYLADIRTNESWFLLRYEDFVLQPASFLAWLRDLGLQPKHEQADDYRSTHQTASSASHSVGRWKRENLATDVNDFFVRHLHREMKVLGYDEGIEFADLCPSFEFRLGQPAPMPSNPAHGHVDLEQEFATVHIEGPDFSIIPPCDPFDAADFREVWVSAAGNIGDHFSLYWRNATAPFSEERVLHVPYTPGSHWRVVRFPTGSHPLWRGDVHELRLDLFNSSDPSRRGTGRIRWMRLIS
jgi:hypothetical protein